MCNVKNVKRTTLDRKVKVYPSETGVISCLSAKTTMLFTLNSSALLFQVFPRLSVIVCEVAFFGWERQNLMLVEVVIPLMALCGSGTFWVELSAVFHTVM